MRYVTGPDAAARHVVAVASLRDLLS